MQTGVHVRHRSYQLLGLVGEGGVSVETEVNFVILEVKSKSEIENEVTKAKAKATLKWIQEMNNVSKKQWQYWLISHEVITSSVNTFKKLINLAVNFY